MTETNRFRDALMLHNNQIKLHGTSYDKIKRLHFYSKCGNAIKKNLIVFGDIYLDTRLSIVTALKSGRGKKEIIESIKSTVPKDNIATATSYHSEHMVGKKILNDKSKKTWQDKFGFLKKDIVIFDDANKFFTELQYKEARSYVNQALDPIGKNEIYKELIDNPENLGIRFTPECTMYFFIQADNIDYENVIRGLLRRFLIIFAEIPETELNDALSDRLFATREDTTSQWITFYNNLKQKTFNWVFSHEVRTEIVNKAREIIATSIPRGKRSSELTNIMTFVIENLIIQMSVIIAAIEDTNVVSLEHVRQAAEDLSLFWFSHLDFLTTYTQFTTKVNINDNHRAMLRILFDNSCFSKETSVLSIHMLHEQFKAITNLKQPTSQKVFDSLKDMGLIERVQEGSTTTKVWIKNRTFVESLI